MLSSLRNLHGEESHTWHPIAIGPNRETHIAITVGTTILPIDEHGNPDPLSENADPGAHSFVAITSPTADIPLDIIQLVTWAHNEAVKMYQVTARVVA